VPKRLLYSSVVMGALGATAMAAPQLPSFDWSGGYIGLQVGYGWTEPTAKFAGFPEAAFAAQLSTLPAGTTFTPAGKGFLGGIELGFNYQVGNFVFGAESDVSWSNAKGATSFSAVDPVSGAYSYSTSQKLDWFGTLRGRFGFAAGDGLLIYGTGGLAFGRTTDSTSLAFAAGANYLGSRSSLRVGWTAGAGVEWAFAPNVSAKVEYLYYDLGRQTAVGLGGAIGAETDTGFDVAGHVVRIGLNYFPNWGIGTPPSPHRDPALDEWDVEAGLRYWAIRGSTKKDLYDTTGSSLVSRLTYSGLDGYAGESYARGDHQSGWFLKGTLGIGKVNSGRLQDEDFPPGITPYSSTDSEQNNGSIAYGNIDQGYNFVRTPTFRAGAFVGYQYYREKLNAYGCAQTAGNPVVCVPAISNPILVISQDNKWQALRLGMSGQISLMDRLILSGEAAWLPYVWLNGADTHWLRLDPSGLTLGAFNGPTPENGRGSGVQFEAILSWLITPNFTVGVGGRYWHMEVPNALAHFDTSANPAGLFSAQVEKWKTDRYGGFVQAGLKW
jgi:opacity protein-like surface antigen